MEKSTILCLPQGLEAEGGVSTPQRMGKKPAADHLNVKPSISRHLIPGVKPLFMLI